MSLQIYIVNYRPNQEYLTSSRQNGGYLKQGLLSKIVPIFPKFLDFPVFKVKPLSAYYCNNTS